jgi:hypothetical protein
MAIPANQHLKKRGASLLDLNTALTDLPPPRFAVFPRASRKGESGPLPFIFHSIGGLDPPNQSLFLLGRRAKPADGELMGSKGEETLPLFPLITVVQCTDSI